MCSRSSWAPGRPLRGAGGLQDFSSPAAGSSYRRSPEAVRTGPVGRSGDYALAREDPLHKRAGILRIWGALVKFLTGYSGGFGVGISGWLGGFGVGSCVCRPGLRPSAALAPRSLVGSAVQAILAWTASTGLPWPVDPSRFASLGATPDWPPQAGTHPKTSIEAAGRIQPAKTVNTRDRNNTTGAGIWGFVFSDARGRPGSPAWGSIRGGAEAARATGGKPPGMAV